MYGGYYDPRYTPSANNYPALVCPQNHQLVFQAGNYPGGQYQCDRCQTPGPCHQHRWRCPSCNYDCCHRCAPPPAQNYQQAPAPMPQAAASPPGSRSCKSGHSLTFEMMPYGGGQYSCDRCGSLASSHQARWLCRPCQYDICHRCLPPYQSQSSQPSYAPQQPYIPPQIPQITGAITPPQVRGRALLIGINYLSTPRSKLNGCINDANNLRYFLTQRGWTQFVVLTDDQHDPNFIPNKANITRAIGWLLEGAQAGQGLFFSYSGHGGQTRDTSGDEASGMDETILPCDYSSAGQIVDDDLHKMLVAPLPEGVRLTCVMDCCHSGTGLDLPYVYDGTRTRSVEETYHDRGLNTKKAARRARARDLGGPGLALLLSGCEDEQTSADATGLAQQGIATGALTYMFLDVMNKNQNFSYADMVQQLRQTMKAKRFTQVPQFSYNLQNFDVRSPVVL